MVNNQKTHFKKHILNIVVSLVLLLLSFCPFYTSAQVVDEVIQIDTISEVTSVIYRPINKSSYYFKKVGVFANDTSQIAIEKTYTSYGQNGAYKVYYPNGKLKIKTVYANNKVNGEWVYYNPKGIIIVKGFYKNGVKDGYWAYKSLRIYGKYKKGLKHKKWKRFDKSENKHISHYSKGQLTAGEGFRGEIPMYRQQKIKAVKVEVKDTGKIIQKDTLQISKEYEAVIFFLSENAIFRKALKNHFGNSMKKSVAIKKLYEKERLQFAISKKITALSLSKFIVESGNNKIVVVKIDSILKNELTNLKEVFSGEIIDENENLHNNSSDRESSMEIIFSELKYNLLRLDAVWTYKEEKRVFQILLYFDDEGVLKGAEYQKS